MIFNEDYVEDENSEPKKIGGIEVDQSEIRRAKKCMLSIVLISV